MNETLNSLNQAAAERESLEAKLTKITNLRNLKESFYKEKRTKVAKKYEDLKAKALGVVSQERDKAISGLDEEITVLTSNIEIQQKRIMELAKDLAKVPDAEFRFKKSILPVNRSWQSTVLPQKANVPF